jgi:hypothetical protein
MMDPLIYALVDPSIDDFDGGLVKHGLSKPIKKYIW